MNGTIQAESEPGKGSRFRINFKNVKIKRIDQEPAETPPMIDVDSIVFEKKTILVVEDNKDIRNSIRLYLEDYDLKIVEAEDGKQGIEAAKKHRPDLIVMDMKMPGMSGFKAVEEIKKDMELEKIPVIAFTAHALKEEEERIMNLGCQKVLKKPVRRHELLLELVEHLPCTIKESSGSIPPENVSPANEFEGPIPRENIEPLIKILETKFMVKYRDIKQSLIIKNARDFALQIKELGANTNAEVLINWAERVLTEIRLANVNKVASFIALFPEVVEHIKSNARS